jgi:hypothetical protein
MDRKIGITLPALCAAALTGTLLASTTGVSAKGHHPPGRIGTSFKLATGAAFHGLDVATSPNGTAYIGWISSTEAVPARVVHLCTLPVGARTCKGGIQSTSAVDGSSASGLQVLVTSDNVVHLVWLHNTAASISGLHGDAIAEATAPDGQNLSAPTDVVTNAPSFGELLTAKVGPDNNIWTVATAGSGVTTIEVRTALANPSISVNVPWGVGNAQLGFTNGPTVLSVQKYGTISTPIQYAKLPSGGAAFGSFKPLAKTWDTANATLTTTRHGLRAISTVDNASYRPVIAKWTGSAFAKRHLTPDHNSCGANTHDSSTDPSGRLLDVSWECHLVAVANYPDAFHAAITRFATPGTTLEAPQISSGTRGIATVAYLIQPNSGDNVLWVAHVRLPDSTHRAGKSSKAGRVTVTGPRTCLPPSDVHIGWSHHAAKHWSFSSGSLRLNGKQVSAGTLDGANLTAGKAFTLVGKATFAKGGTHRSVTAKLPFRTCAAG